MYRVILIQDGDLNQLVFLSLNRFFENKKKKNYVKSNLISDGYFKQFGLLSLSY